MDKIPNLSHLDIENNILHEANFEYYTPQQFHSSDDINHSSQTESFSLLHCNIRSIAANYDKLTELLSELNYPFKIIGLSETKIIKNIGQISNTSLPGYEFISQPTLSQAGGVGLYIRNNTEFHIREDLSCMMQEFESLWIEIHCNPAKNIICGVLYRHPNRKLETFNNYLFSAVNKISKENKYCAFMGDFNINLLNGENCSFSEDFVNTLGSYYFLPQILQQPELLTIRLH